MRPFEGDGAVQEGASTHVREVVGPYPKLPSREGECPTAMTVTVYMLGRRSARRSRSQCRSRPRRRCRPPRAPTAPGEPAGARRGSQGGKGAPRRASRCLMTTPWHSASKRWDLSAVGCLRPWKLRIFSARCSKRRQRAPWSHGRSYYRTPLPPRSSASPMDPSGRLPCPLALPPEPGLSVRALELEEPRRVQPRIFALSPS